jgi:anti-sigma B factor antagonist
MAELGIHLDCHFLLSRPRLLAADDANHETRGKHLKNNGACRTFTSAGLAGRRSRGGALDINVRKRSEVQLIQLRGPLRLGSAVDELRQVIEEAVGQGDTRIAINLAEVPMIDSSGIGLLVRFLASTKQRGGNIKLVQPSKFAVQTLRLVGVLNLFEIFDNDDAAVESFA